MRTPQSRKGASDNHGQSALCKLSVKSGARKSRVKIAAVHGPQQQSTTLLVPVARTSLGWSPLLHGFTDGPGQKKPSSRGSVDKSSLAGIRGIDAKKALDVLREARRYVAAGYAPRASLWCDKNGKQDGDAVAWSLAGAIQSAGDGQAICFHVRHAVAKVAGAPDLVKVERNPLFGRKDALALLDKTIRLVEGLAIEPGRPGPKLGERPTPKQVEAIRAELAKKRVAYMEKLAGGAA